VLDIFEEGLKNYVIRLASNCILLLSVSQVARIAA
jgi:hypothetical protein